MMNLESYMVQSVTINGPDYDQTEIIKLCCPRGRVALTCNLEKPSDIENR